jgi:FkbM family methyltransferase
MNTMVDAGANMGLFTLFAKKGNSNLAVYAFEPIRETYSVLLRNIELHHLEGVKPFNFALGSEDQMERIFTYYLHPAGNSTATPELKRI